MSEELDRVEWRGDDDVAGERVGPVYLVYKNGVVEMEDRALFTRRAAQGYADALGVPLLAASEGAPAVI